MMEMIMIVSSIFPLFPLNFSLQIFINAAMNKEKKNEEKKKKSKKLFLYTHTRYIIKYIFVHAYLNENYEKIL